jgi:ABC-type transport system substrate-binding protein
MGRAPRRRSLDEAKRLLAEAGWPGGRDRNGKQLEIRFANAWNSAEQVALLRWLGQKFDAIGVRLVSETTDYNRFQEKVHQGNFQMLSWGWIADYPDPENFLFLLYGPNGQKLHNGENHSNYDSPEYNRVFERLETMENSPARLALIRKALAVSQRDAPLAWGYHPMSLGLYHAWLRNTKPHAVMNSTLTYYRLDARMREDSRSAWNRPVIWPLVAGVLLLILVAVPALIAVRRRLERVG